MRFKHIIWDWNGTLLDDRWLTVSAMNEVLARRNLPVLDEERYLEIFTFPVIEYYSKLGFNFEEEPFSVSGSEFIEHYNRRALEPKLHDNAVEILSLCQESGITQSLLSASRQAYLDHQIQHHGLGKYFIRAIGQTDHYAFGKSEAGQAWMKELKQRPDEVLFVGDTVHDHEVAELMGVDCVLLSQGHTSRGRLKVNGVPVFDSLLELSRWLQQGRLKEKGKR